MLGIRLRLAKSPNIIEMLFIFFDVVILSFLKYPNNGT
jgi:hypothetical protein